MPWSELIGHERAVSILRRALAQDRLHHAWLFHGPEGVGKRTAALLLARSLLCTSAGGAGAGSSSAGPANPDPCGICSACRRIASSNHPDVVQLGLGVSPSTGRLRQEIVIEQIRELGRFLHYRPIEGRRRVAIVDPADRMNAAAANAFLKTLEEPPSHAVIVLIAASPASLLETVRSRCHPLAFGRLPVALVEQVLLRDGAEEADARLAAALTDGAIGGARSLLQTTEKPHALELSLFRQRRDRILDALLLLAAAEKGPGTSVLRAAEAFSPKDPEELAASFDIAEALLRDALLAASGCGQPVAAADVPDRVLTLARALGEDRAAASVAAAERIRADFRLNVNRQLAVEAFLSELILGSRDHARALAR